ncbi:MAG: hypothetical protein JSS75_08655 [Bacteroidetes bacterium]|nr:hypothetical protein [Bacteroidota bacterium]
MIIGKSVVAVGLIALCSAVTGCGMLLASKYDTVTVSVTPDSSKVFANGQFLGYSPVRAELAPRERQVIEVRHDGFEPQTLIMATDIHPLWLTADVILTAGLGAIFDATSGGWNKFRAPHIVMDLSKLPPPGTQD